MKNFALRILGREILAINISDPAPTPEPDPPATPATPEIPDGFGFHGGSGGTQQPTWKPTTTGPIDAR